MVGRSRAGFDTPGESLSSALRSAAMIGPSLPEPPARRHDADRIADRSPVAPHGRRCGSRTGLTAR